jgi:hypothetical protein
MPRKEFVAFTRLDASDVNTYLMDQSIMTFANSAARGSAIATPVEGMVSYLEDTNSYQFYDGSAWTGLVPQSGNAIINGAFDIWQRGTSFASQATLASGYSADRFHFYRDTGNTGATLSRVDSTLPGFQFAARLQRNSGNTSTTGINIRQTVETSNSLQFAGQSVTFSFFARAGANYSASSQALNVVLATGTGVDQPVYSFTGASEIVNSSATLTSSWQRFTYTASVASTAKEIGFTLKATPTGTAGTNDWFEITGIQLEAGSVATPFKRNANSLQGELAACERYFQVVDAGVFSALNTTTLTGAQNFRTQMRSAPSVALTAAMAISDGQTDFTQSSANISIAVSRATTTGIQLVMANFTGLTQFRPYVITVLSSKIQLNSEL